MAVFGRGPLVDAWRSCRGCVCGTKERLEAVDAKNALERRLALLTSSMRRQGPRSEFILDSNGEEGDKEAVDVACGQPVRSWGSQGGRFISCASGGGVAVAVRLPKKAWGVVSAEHIRGDGGCSSRETERMPVFVVG